MNIMTFNSSTEQTVDNEQTISHIDHDKEDFVTIYMNPVENIQTYITLTREEFDKIRSAFESPALY